MSKRYKNFCGDKDCGRALTRIVIVLSVLALWNAVSMMMITAGIAFVSMTLTLVVDIGALALILVYLPKLKW